MKNLKQWIETLNNKENKWLIKDLIPHGEISVLYGKTDHFKTFLILKIALEVLTQGSDLETQKSGRVLIYSPDTHQQDLMTRLKGLIKARYSEKEEHILENLELEFEPLDFSNTYWKTILEYDEDEDKEELINFGWHEFGWHLIVERHKEKKPSYITLVIIDTLSQSIGSSSLNDEVAVRKVIKNIKAVIRQREIASPLSFLIVAHAGKDATKGLMGSSLLKNDIPTVLKIRNKGKQLELCREKIKSKMSGKSVPFKMREVVLDDGQETLYVDIGAGLTEFEAEILNLHEQGFDKESIKDNIRETELDNTTTRKSFNVVFNRCWNKLIDTGFIKE